MKDQPPDRNPDSIQKVALYLVGGAGLLVWAILLLYILNRRYSLAGLFGMAQPPAHVTAAPTSHAPSVPTLTLPATWTPTPSSRPPTLTPVPTPMSSGVSMVPIDGDIEVVALLGIDEGHDAPVWRTDTIILAFADRKAGRLSLLSIPRDLWVRVPGHPDNRINTVDALGERGGHAGGGPALLDKTMRFNLGIPVHHHVRIDFAGFVRIVDALGGVTVDVTEPLDGPFPDPSSPTGWGWITIPAGPRHMNGRDVLTYCRSRITTDDFDRSARQRQVLLVLWRKALTLETLARAPQLWDEFKDAFETDLDLGEVVQFARFVHGLDPDQVRSEQFDYRLTQEWTTPQGAQVLLPRTDAIQQTILELVSAEPGG